MVIWFKKISYHTVTKIVAIMLLCICSIQFVVGGAQVYRGLSNEAYLGSYEATTGFLWDVLVPKASYVRDWIVRYADEGIFNPDLVDVEVYKANYATEIRTLQSKELDKVAYEEALELLEARIRSEVIRDRRAYYEAY